MLRSPTKKERWDRNKKGGEKRRGEKGTERKEWEAEARRRMILVRGVEKGEEGKKRGRGAQQEGGGKEDRHTGRGREEAIRATRARGDEENTRTR